MAGFERSIYLPAIIKKEMSKRQGNAMFLNEKVACTENRTGKFKTD